jgi:hypothetical protein
LLLALPPDILLLGAGCLPRAEWLQRGEREYRGDFGGRFLAQVPMSLTLQPLVSRTESNQVCFYRGDRSRVFQSAVQGTFASVSNFKGEKKRKKRGKKTKKHLQTKKLLKSPLRYQRRLAIALLYSV